jgi:hypothetical protein
VVAATLNTPQGKGKWTTAKGLSVFKPLDLHGRYPQQGRKWGSP